MASPTKWNIDDKFTFLSVSSDGLEVTYVGPGEKADSAAIRADLPILPQCGLFYFEINILDKGDNGEIGIGFCAKTVNLNRMPGWENNSWGYHGDDGNFYCCSGTGKSYGPLFTTGDTIGCCLNFRYKVAFYTKNGVHLGIAFQDLEGELYPCVGMRSRGGSMKVNFGHEKFKYTAINDDDISDKLLKEKWVKAINQCNDELVNQQIDRIDRLSDLTESMEIEPNNISELKCQVKAYFIMGVYEEALAYLTKLLKIVPNDTFALRYKGEIYHVMKRHKESLAILNKLLEIEINDAWALRALKEVTRKVRERNLDLSAFAAFSRNAVRTLERDDNYGECEQCKQHNTSPAWCKSCDPEKLIQGWTSGVKDVDDCIKEFQLKTTKYENIIEWISFDKLSNIEKIGEGGFSLVFSANWLDGTRKIEGNYGNYTRSREKSSIIALKTFSNSKLNVLDFLNEFKGHMNFKLKDSGLKIYGITRNTENEYLIVFQYANRGNFYHFLKSDFKQLTWKSKLQQLVYISFNLAKIHKEGYIHGNFHSGNILQNQENNESIQSYITDLVLFKKNIEHFSEKIIYGVMPYFAPEVLLGQHYSQAADIYSLGIIMTEISTGVRPFDGYLFDKEFASKICKGLRPELAPETPNCYIELVKQCTDSDPLKRPTANDVGLKLYKWLDVILYLPDNDEGLDIRKKFLDADNVIQTLPTIPQIHPDFMYTSKAINTQEIKDILDSRQI